MTEGGGEKENSDQEHRLDKENTTETLNSEEDQSNQEFPEIVILETENPKQEERQDTDRLASDSNAQKPDADEEDKEDEDDETDGEIVFDEEIPNEEATDSTASASNATSERKFESTVTIHGNGGLIDGQETLSMEYGYGIWIHPENQWGEKLSREGYVFDAFYWDEECTNRAPFNIRIEDEDLELYASWKKLYQITIHGNGGLIDDQENLSVEIEDGSYYDPEIEWKNKVSREGYTFFGFYWDEACTNKVSSSFQVEEDKELYIRWEKAYQITFDYNGITYKGETQRVVFVEQGKKLDTVSRLPSFPEEDSEQTGGKLLKGWQSEDGSFIEYIGSYVPEKDEVLTAVWSDYYEIIFDYCGATNSYGEKEKSYKILVGEKIGGISSEVPREYEGKILIGWVTESGEVLKGNDVFAYYDYVPTKNETLTALWSSYYTVTYKAGEGKWNSGDPDKHIEKIAAGNSAYVYENLSKDGAVLVGWKMEGTDEWVKLRDYIPTSDVTLVAQWSGYWTVSYDPNGGSFTSEYYGKPEQVAYGSAVSLPGDYNLKRNGYALLGWCTNPEGTGPVYTNNFTPTSDVTLYAKWGDVRQVTLDAGIGSFANGKKTKMLELAEGESVATKIDSDANTPTATDVMFDGWYLDEACTRRIGRGYVPTADVTFYAKWIPIQETYTVTVHAGGPYFEDPVSGEYVETGTFSIKKGNKIGSITTLYREDYDEQWYLDEAGTLPISSSYIPERDVDVYAKWWRRYRVTFDANGGINSRGERSYTTTEREGGCTSLSSSREFKKEGYALVGWFTEEGEEFTSHTPVYADMRVYAKWEKGYKLTIDLDGGSFSNSSDEEQYSSASWYMADQKIEYIGIPKRDGYAFLGWECSADEKLYPYSPSNMKLTQDTVLTAKWTENTHTITLHAIGGYMYDNIAKKYLEEKKVLVPHGKLPNGNIIGSATNDRGNSTMKWATTPDGSPINLNQYEFTCDMDLYAIWQDKWQISLIMNGGCYSSSNINDCYSTSVVRGEAMSYPRAEEMVRDGYTFGGWYTTPNFAEDSRVEIPGYVPTHNCFLYAKWIPGNLKQYTVTFETNGGSALDPISVVRGACLSVPAEPSRDGAVFKGWYTNKECTIPYDFSRPISKNLTLYAGWIETVDLADTSVKWTQTVVYNGAEQRPKPEVRMGAKLLTEGVDYTISYENNINAGKATLTIKAIGEIYKGEKTVSFTIEQAEPNVAIPQGPFVMTYGQKLKEVQLPDGWSWKEPSRYFDAGEYKAETIYDAKDANYKVKTATLTVRVEKKSLEDTDVVIELQAPIGGYTYQDGNPVVPVRVTIRVGYETLRVEDDYTLSYEDHTKIGMAKVIVTGIKNYTGRVEKTYEIKPGDPQIHVANKTYLATYGQKLKDIANQLPPGWSWQNPEEAVGAATVIGDEHGTRSFLADFDNKENPNYVSKKDVPLKVLVSPYNIEELEGKIDPKYHLYTGKEIKPKLTLVDRYKNTLVEGRDYTLSYKNNVAVTKEGQTAEVIAAGTGNYKGVVTASFVIVDDPYNLERARIVGIPEEETYTGEEITPELQVLALEPGNLSEYRPLIEGKDYTLEYVDNIEPGLASVIITGTGSKENGGYYGRQRVTFFINPVNYVLEATYGMKLKDVKLPKNWSWINPEESVGNVAEKGSVFVASYDKDDTIRKSAGFLVKVVPKSINDSTVRITVDETVIWQPGGTVPKVSVYDEQTEQELAQGLDYRLEYNKDANAGEATVTIEGKRNYEGNRNHTYIIEQAKPELDAKSDKIQGETIDIGIKDGSFFLYTTRKGEGIIRFTSSNPKVFRVDDCTNDHGEADGRITPTGIGDAILTIETTGDVNYEDGKKEYTVKVHESDLRESDVILQEKSYRYTGSQIRPKLIVTAYGEKLEEGVDYTVLYGENINAGAEAGSVTVTGIGNYRGSVGLTFDIEKIENPAIIPGVRYEAVYGERVSEFQLPDGWQWSEPDAILSELGTVFVPMVLPETQNYLKKEADAIFTVEERALEPYMLKLEYTSTVYDGQAKLPEVFPSGDLLTKEDFTVMYVDNIKAGTAQVLVFAKNHFKGELVKSFIIEKAESKITLGVEATLEKRVGDADFNLGAKEANGGTLTYESSDPQVAEVDAEGTVKVKSAGNVTIVVYCAGDSNHKETEESVTLYVKAKTSEESSDSQEPNDSAYDANASAAPLPKGYTGATKMLHGMVVPADVKEGTWTYQANGRWSFADLAGNLYKNGWVHVYNSYANTAFGQPAYGWFHFDENAFMQTGWISDGKNTYYLNPISDNTRGMMVTGWKQIEGKWYYFQETSDGTRGRMYRNEHTPDGYYVDENGVWDGNPAKH